MCARREEVGRGIIRLLIIHLARVLVQALVQMKDRWGHTPLDEAKRANQAETLAILEAAVETSCT